MTLSFAPPPAVFPNLTDQARAATLSRMFEGLSAEAMLAEALNGDLGRRIAMVSSFGAESVALLHMVASVDPATPVIFLDTEMLFPETLAYQAEVAEHLGLSDLRIIRPDAADLAQGDAAGDLHRSEPDSCCELRKTRPLERALRGFDGWITGRKRYQSGERAVMPLFETDDAGRLKLNPLADWKAGDAGAYIRAHNLPPHPLIARGYPSIGCAPCTSPVSEGEDPRAGRWRGAAKTECGIHFVNGKLVRT